MKIGIVGCAGRMGRMLVREINAAKDCELAGGTESRGSAFIGLDMGQLCEDRQSVGTKIIDDAEELFAISDAVIDFTAPNATARHADFAAASGAAFVVGTTGLEPGHQAMIDAAATRVAVVQASNFSVGVTLLSGLVEQAARLLDSNYDIEVLEMHHRNKVDAPSGTALTLGKAAALGRGVDLDSVSDRVRDGITGPRTEGNIGFATLRGGDVVGDHTVIFAGQSERIELTHKAANRSIFANGAVRAAVWAAGQDAGKYSIRDMLGLD